MYMYILPVKVKYKTLGLKAVKNMSLNVSDLFDHRSNKSKMFRLIILAAFLLFGIYYKCSFKLLA